MTKLHEWEVIHSVKVQDYGACAMTRRLAVPGGWMYEVRAQWDERKPTLISVPDPTAPHCQPTPPADDRPPMTDDALEAWLTTTYGEPEHRDGTRADGVRYKMTHWFKHFSDDEDGFVEVATRCRNDWQTHHGGGWLPAWVIGPALWAAHRYSNP